ncbi:hypothetical protein ACIA8G_30600 [Lentzea sp. NPDC051213]|uniref:hypothetical protein n=1 Tax=Lentzea sp. NPDC051213 TaxID=3364126 RepID=UPI0037A2470D
MTMLATPSRAEASGYGQFVLAAVGLVIMLGDMVVKAFTSATPPDVDQLADDLAEAMRNQWEQAAVDRGLLQPIPLPIRWRRCTARVAGPMSAATIDEDGHAPFDPLPGMGQVAPDSLLKGTRRDLHRVYGGLGSGRLVVVGGPGTGKSSAALLLLLDALRYRDQLDPAQRPQVPVPVMFTLAGWDPDTTSVEEWLTGKLTENQTLGARRGANHARSLIHAKQIAVFLDGLDEIPEQTRLSTLRALSAQATFRLVLLTRTDELVAVAAHHGLDGAIALELLPPHPTDVANYLLRPLTEPAPHAWQKLTTALIEDPSCPAAQAFTRPLAVGLLRDVYTANAPVDELLERDRFPDHDTIIGHLLDRAVIAAYTRRPGRPAPRYALSTAQHTLASIAQQLSGHNTRDLAWWTIATWVPRKPLMTAVFGLGAGLVYGLAFGLTFGLWFGLALGLVFAIGAGLVAGFTSSSGPRRLQLDRSTWRLGVAAPGLSAFKSAAKLGLLFGLILGLVAGFVSGPIFGLVAGLVLSLVAGLTIWLTTRLMAEPRSVPTRSASPAEAWRDDLLAGLITGSVAGLMVGLTFGVGAGLLYGFETGLVYGLAAGVAFGLGAGLQGLDSGQAVVAQAYLSVRHRTPLRLMRFLEDARSRHLLRTVGPIYQFRHATLQDRLADTQKSDREPPPRPSQQSGSG